MPRHTECATLMRHFELKYRWWLIGDLATHPLPSATFFGEMAKKVVFGREAKWKITFSRDAEANPVGGEKRNGFIEWIALITMWVNRKDSQSTRWLVNGSAMSFQWHFHAFPWGRWAVSFINGVDERWFDDLPINFQSVDGTRWRLPMTDWPLATVFR